VEYVVDFLGILLQLIGVVAAGECQLCYSRHCGRGKDSLVWKRWGAVVTVAEGFQTNSKTPVAIV